MTQPEALALSSIRNALIRQEDTIIFALIERSQYAQNPPCYDRKAAVYDSVAAKDASLLDFMLLETERLHARVRRYTSPDEHAFFPHRLPAPQLPLLDFPPVLHPSVCNLNGEVMDMYLNHVVPGLCEATDDQQHGSCVVADIAALQAISKRVHYGFYVAESKFQEKPEQYTRLIEEEDEAGIMELLTNAKVEDRVLQRVFLKASTFGQEIEAPKSPSLGPTSPGSTFAAPAPAPSNTRIDPDLIVKIYRDHVIPLTKVAEVKYLLQRLSRQQIAHHGSAGSACHQAAVLRFIRSCPPGKAAPQLMQCMYAADVFGQVMASKATYGVVLLEQGDSGVLAVTRSLLRSSSLRVVGEIVRESRFALYSRAKLAEVRRVRARPAVLRLCGVWLTEVLAGAVELVEVDLDPHGSQAPWDGTLDRSEDDATAYLVEANTDPHPSLSLLASAPDSMCEYARCVVLEKPRKTPSEPSGHDKSLILFALSKDEPGALARTLAAFHASGVNLRSIQSYANLQEANVVDFFIETDGHESDPALSAALIQLRSQAVDFKLLGSYPIKPPAFSEAASDSFHGARNFAIS